MMRAYTAWVIQSGKGETTEYLTAKGSPDDGWVWTASLRDATQFCRRSDARHVIDQFVVGDDARAVEKTIG